MNVIPVSIAAGALVISGLSALALRGEVQDQADELGRLRARLEEAVAAHAAPAEDPGEARVQGLLARLEERVTRLERAPRREPVTADEAVARPERGAAASPEAAREERTPEEDAERAEMEELLELFGSGYDWDGSTEKMQRFYELARKTGLVDEKIGELEEAVEADPGDLDARMELADTYVAKLMTIQGPEQGLWGAKAEEQWREVATRDPEHWRATFSLGLNYAYYPDVMGKTDDAIAYLERAREIQERSTQTEEQVRTYLTLARMYQRKGDLDRARAVVRAGLAYHPGNAELAAALDGLGG